MTREQHDKLIDDMTHAAMRVLAAAGVNYTTADIDRLNDYMTDYVNDTCEPIDNLDSKAEAADAMGEVYDRARDREEEDRVHGEKP